MVHVLGVGIIRGTVETSQREAVDRISVGHILCNLCVDGHLCGKQVVQGDSSRLQVVLSEYQEKINRKSRTARN